MNICADNHDEVCYTSMSCPVCAVVSEIDDKDREIKELTADLKDSIADIDKLEDQIEALKALAG